MTQIAEQWDDYGATVVRTIYYPLSPANDAAVLTATRVAASYREWVPGYNCPDGFEFSDGSVCRRFTLSI